MSRFRRRHFWPSCKWRTSGAQSFSCRIDCYRRMVIPMSALTAVVLAALGLYVLAMIGGQVPTDFALFLFVCTAVSGAYFGAEAWFFAPRRREQTVRALLEFDRRNKPALEARPEAF